MVLTSRESLFTRMTYATAELIINPCVAGSVERNAADTAAGYSR